MNIYDELIKTLEKDKETMGNLYEKCKYYRQKQPDMYLLSGMMSFMLLSMMGLMCFLFSVAFSDNAQTIDLMMVRKLWLGIAFLSWFVVGPLLVFRYRYQNRYIAQAMGKQTIMEGMMTWFELTQQSLNIHIKNSIIEDALSEWKDRQSIRRKMQNSDNTERNQNHIEKYQDFLNDIDNRLTDYINNKYSVIYFFERYMSRDMWKTFMEAMMSAMFMTIVWLFPYFDPQNQPANLWVILITAIIGFCIPFVSNWITFFWHKRAYRQVIEKYDTGLTAKSKYYDIEEEYKDKLEELKKEYVIALLEAVDS